MTALYLYARSVQRRLERTAGERQHHSLDWRTARDAEHHLLPTCLRFHRRLELPRTPRRSPVQRLDHIIRLQAPNRKRVIRCNSIEPHTDTMRVLPPGTHE